MKQYHKHLQAILDKGTLKPAAREGMPGSISLFGHQNRYDLSKGFPIMTTKKVNFNTIVTELLWFLKGDTNIKYLIDNGCNIWNEDAYNYYCKICKEKSLTPLPYSTFIDRIRLHDPMNKNHFPNYTLGDCGTQYGATWRNWDYEQGGGIEFTLDQIAKVIESLTNNPQSRRHIITAIDPTKDEDLALYWCHCMFQFNARPLNIEERLGILQDVVIPSLEEEDLHKYLDRQNIPKYRLDCNLYQRSADMFLGVPFNIASYSLLIHIICKITNMIPGEFIHSFGDSHIYENHIEQVKELLSRDTTKYKLPTLNINCNFNNDLGTDLFDDIEPSDFTLQGYESYPRIKAKLSTGLK